MPARSATSACGAGLRLATLVIVASAAGAPAMGKPARAPLAAADEALRAGRYEEVLRLAGKAGAQRPAARTPAAAVLAARAEMALGRYEPARARLEAASAAAPRDLPVRHALFDLYEATGDRAALATLVDVTYDDWRAGRVDRTRAPDLLAVAAAVRLDNNWQDANDTLRAAVRADPSSTRPNVQWGAVFLEKHAVGEAERSFRAALEIDAADPDAHAGLAAVLLQKSYDVAGAERELALALRGNPRHAGALVLRAEMALDSEDFSAAESVIAELRRTNPRHPHAAWLAAARARLLDDDEGYRRERDHHAELHATDGGFFASVADVLVRHRRYDDARAVADEGAALDPDSARCQSVLGTTLLRLGEEAAGLSALRRAWKRDPYDARTYNLLELFEKVIPKYETLATAHLRFRVDPRARRAVELVVAPFLEETYLRYVRRYGLEPPGPITFELYTDPDAYAIRTVGMPGISVTAVCFGRVITAQSPTNGTSNWGMVLAHELAHVFAMHLSRSRVPRWFTEGLSELETMRARPEWRRHHGRELWGAAQRHELPTLAALSSAFVRARGPEALTLAYAEAAAALDHLERRFGFPRLREALVRYGKGERGLEVVAAAAGIAVADLEQGFRADLEGRLVAFDRQYLPAQLLRSSRAAAEQALATAPAPERPRALARLGLALLAEGDRVAATAALDRARAETRGAGAAGAENKPAGRGPRPDARAVLFLAGELALAERRAADAAAAFGALVSLPDGAGDGYDVRARLALAEIHRRDLAAAEQHIRRALAFDPESIEAHGLLVELLGDPDWKDRRRDDRLEAVGAVLRLEPLHADLAKELVLGLGRRGRSSALIEAAELAIFIDPGAVDVHTALARALTNASKLQQAAGALKRAAALGASPEDVAEIQRLLDGATAKLTRTSRPAAAPAPGPRVQPGQR